MPLESLNAVAPGLADRIVGAAPGDARRFAFGVARLACSVAGVEDRTAIEIATGGLARGAAVDELVLLWELERQLDAACDAQLDPDAPYPGPAELRLHEECAEARAVAAVIAALKPDPHIAAAEAAYDAWAAGCEQSEIEALAAPLRPRSDGRPGHRPGP